MKRVPHSYLLDFSKKPKWSYVMGIEMEGMLDTYEAYKGRATEAILEYLKEYPAEMIDEQGNITGYKYEDFNLDNVRTAKFILRMHNLFPTKGTEKALKTLFKQLAEPASHQGRRLLAQGYLCQPGLARRYLHGLAFLLQLCRTDHEAKEGEEISRRCR